MRIIKLNINGILRETAAPDNATLAEVLRENFNLTGTKIGCGVGECGSCTILLDDKPLSSCLALAAEVQGCEIMTIEGLTAGGELHPVQRAFIETGAIQCGYCTPGMILVAYALLNENPAPCETDIRRALSGNLCRCTGYQKIVEAVMLAAEWLESGICEREAE